MTGTEKADRMTGTEKALVQPGGDRRASPKRSDRKRRGLLRRYPLPPVVREFQSDAAEIEQRNPPRVARMTLYCVVAMIAAAVTWASVSQVDMVVTGQG